MLPKLGRQKDASKIWIAAYHARFPTPKIATMSNIDRFWTIDIAELSDASIAAMAHE
jgi:hypothetical protein